MSRGDGEAERTTASGVPDEAGARSAAVERLLARHGVEAARVEAVGHECEIAAVTAAVESLDRLADLAAEIKSMGFEYVALDLRPDA